MACRKLIDSLLLNLQSHDVVSPHEVSLLRELIWRDRRFKVDEEIAWVETNCAGVPI